MPEKGVFTQDFRAGLIAGQFDIAVHSWKDLAIEENPDTKIVATLPRADVRDVFLVRADRWDEVNRTGRLRILTSSSRRSYNLEEFLPHVLPAKLDALEFVPVRGNVPTRVQKMWQPDIDGLVVAKAALDRLLETERAEFADTGADLRRALSECRWMVLPLSANPARQVRALWQSSASANARSCGICCYHQLRRDISNCGARARDTQRLWRGCHQKMV